MSYAGAIYTVLAADATLTALVQVFQHRAVPATSIDRETYPESYDANGLLLPRLVVKGRGTIPDGRIEDMDSQYASVRQVVELWFHADRDAGWDTLEAAADRCYALLQYRKVAGSFQVKLVNEIDEERDPDMGDACLARRDYEVIGFKSA